MLPFRFVWVEAIRFKQLSMTPVVMKFKSHYIAGLLTFLFFFPESHEQFNFHHISNDCVFCLISIYDENFKQY